LAQGTIDNPVINSPFREPDRHFKVVDGQVSGEIDARRRPSEFFVPVAKPKKASAQLSLQFGGGIRQQPNEIVNEIRGYAKKESPAPPATPATPATANSTPPWKRPG
jgi:type III restriction enzyme